ncbi:MAG TPA: CaiB/BaiF CoA-transferase family protein [Actinomycetota bacterium]
MSGPLEGIRVLDLTRLLPGNHCTLLLADLGADVVKVEEPGRGDYVRWFEPLVDGVSAIHRAVNRGKRSVALDLKRPEGVDAFRRLAAGTDALIESFRPGVMDRLGVGYEALSVENPRLVWCSISGFGQDGPYRDRVGHDLNYLGYAGVLHAAGPPGGVPWPPPVQPSDLAAGMAGALGVVASLMDVARTGRGRFVDASMLDAAVSWGVMGMAVLLGTGSPPPRGGTMLTGGLACYRVYRCAGGGLLSVAALEERFWRNLCRALEAPDLLEGHLDPAEQGRLTARLEEIFATQPRDEWVERLAGLETCVGPVLDMAEAMEDPQVRHRGLAEVDGEVVGPGPTLRVSGAEADLRPAPGLGEHTEEVLRETGLSDEEIAALR